MWRSLAEEFSGSWRLWYLKTQWTVFLRLYRAISYEGSSFLPIFGSETWVWNILLTSVNCVPVSFPKRKGIFLFFTSHCWGQLPNPLQTLSIDRKLPLCKQSSYLLEKYFWSNWEIDQNVRLLQWCLSNLSVLCTCGNDTLHARYCAALATLCFVASSKSHLLTRGAERLDNLLVVLYYLNIPEVIRCGC